DYSMPVLVVDDYATMIRIIRNLLKQIGFADVDDANDGSTALAKMREKRYGLVISDWNMEPMTGYDLLRKVRADPELGATPFIMVTAESKTENVIAARKAGVNNYIVKPFNAQTLKTKIESVLGDARYVPRAYSTTEKQSPQCEAAGEALRRAARRPKSRVQARQTRRPAPAGLFCVQARHDEEAIEPKRSGALQIRSHGITDRQHARHRRWPAAQRRGFAKRSLVEWRIGLAAIEHLHAARSVGVRDRSGAIDELVAAFDNDVRIGAHHEQRARPHRRQQFAIVLRRLARVVEQAGAHHIIGGLGRCEGDIEAGED